MSKKTQIVVLVVLVVLFAGAVAGFSLKGDLLKGFMRGGTQKTSWVAAASCPVIEVPVIEEVFNHPNIYFVNPGDTHVVSEFIVQANEEVAINLNNVHLWMAGLLPEALKQNRFYLYIDDKLVDTVKKDNYGHLKFSFDPVLIKPGSYVTLRVDYAFPDEDAFAEYPDAIETMALYFVNMSWEANPRRSVYKWHDDCDVVEVGGYPYFELQAAIVVTENDLDGYSEEALDAAGY